MDHESKYDNDKADPYFTPQQWELRCRKVEEHCDKFYEAALNEEIPVKDGELVMSSTQAGCNCVAHQSELEWVYKLIDVPEPLTDDWGCKLANILLPIIFRQAGLFQLDVEDVWQENLH